MKKNRFDLLEKSPNFISLPKKEKKPRAIKPLIKEKDLQSMAENMCIKSGIRFFRIPDKLLHFLSFAAPAWTRIFVARYFAGVPDMMLFKRSKSGLNEVLFLEIKTEAGKLSQSQVKWHSGLNVKVCYGWNEVESVITNFLVETV